MTRPASGLVALISSHSQNAECARTRSWRSSSAVIHAFAFGAFGSMPYSPTRSGAPQPAASAAARSIEGASSAGSPLA